MERSLGHDGQSGGSPTPPASWWTAMPTSYARRSAFDYNSTASISQISTM